MSKKEKAGKVILILLGVAFIFVMLVLPLITVLIYALREGWRVFTAAVTDRYTVLARVWSFLLLGDHEVPFSGEADPHHPD